MTRRLTHACAVEIRRDLSKRANCVGLSATNLRALDAVKDYTLSWGKLEDTLYLGVLAAFTFGVDRAEPWMAKRTRESLRVLADLALIECEPPKGRAGSTGPGYRVKVRTSIELVWQDDTETDPDSGSLPQTTDLDSGSVVEETDPDLGPKQTPDQGSYLEVSTLKKNSSKGNAVLQEALELVEQRRNLISSSTTKDNPDAWLQASRNGIRSDLIAAQQPDDTAETLADRVAPPAPPRRPEPEAQAQAAFRSRVAHGDAQRNGTACHTCHDRPYLAEEATECTPCPTCRPARAREFATAS